MSAPCTGVALGLYGTPPADGLVNKYAETGIIHSGSVSLNNVVQSTGASPTCTPALPAAKRRYMTQAAAMFAMRLPSDAPWTSHAVQHKLLRSPQQYVWCERRLGWGEPECCCVTTVECQLFRCCWCHTSSRRSCQQHQHVPGIAACPNRPFPHQHPLSLLCCYNTSQAGVLLPLPAEGASHPHSHSSCLQP
jgi:hypothetical protein